MRATRGFLGGLVLAALAWCGTPAAHADAAIVRVFDAPGWGGIGDIVADPGMDRMTIVGRYSQSVDTYEVSTGRLVKRVSGSAVISLAVNPSTHRVYASQQYAGIKVLDSVTGEQLEEIIPPDGGGAVQDLVVDPRTNRLYMLRDRDQDPSTDDLQLLTLDASGLNPHANLGVVLTGMTGMPWSRLAINSVTGRLYVSRGDAGQPNHGGGTLAVFDATTLARVASVPLGSTTAGLIAVNPATNKVYVGLWGAGIAVVDGATNTLLRTIPTTGGYRAGYSCCNSLTNRIYFADPGITVVDGSTDTVVGTLPITAVGGVYGATLDEPTGQVLVHTGDDKLYVVKDVVATAAGWSARKAMPTARFVLGAASLNGRIYAVGGASGGNGTELGTLEVYDPASDSWTAKASMPTARTNVRFVAVGGLLYAIGGDANNTAFATVEAYDPVTDTWTTKAPLPEPRFGHAAAVLNGLIYVMGGGGGSDGQSKTSVVIYDPQTNTWTPGQPMLSARQYFPATVANGLLYAVGGINSQAGANVLAVESFDPSTNRWTARASLPSSQPTAMAGTIDGKVYVAGGLGYNDGVGASMATLRVYDPASDSWQTGPSMSIGRGGPGGTVLNGVLYAIGGYSSTSGFLNSVEAFGTESAAVHAPADVAEEADLGEGGATVNFVVDVTGNPPTTAVLTVVDVSGGRTLLSVPATAGSFGVGPVTFPLGSSLIEVRITDGTQVLSSGSFTVHVADTTPPVLSGVEAKTVECLGHATPVTPEMLGISATDSVDPHPAVTLVPSMLALGPNSVTATARDFSGNTASSPFDVTVVDTQAPFFTIVPEDVSRSCEGVSGATVAFDVRAEDLCGEVTIVSVDETGRTVDPAGTTYAIGVHTITCTATDSSLNAATCSFQVTIVDEDAPVLVCPGDITAATDAGKATAAVSFTVTATDACDTQISISCTAPWGEVHSGDAFPLGLTTVTCTAQDHSGNEATCSFRILVVDREAPVITAPATAVLVTDCAGSPLGITPALLGVTAADNADPSPRLACSPSSLSPGTTTVDCTATDAAGNVAQASVSVTVLRGAFQVQFLRPLDGAVDNVVKAGQTVPVKIRVSCNNVFDSGVTATVDSVTQIDGSGTPVANATVEDSGLSNDSGTTMRLADGQYVYNLSTKGWASTSGARFRVRVRVQETGHVDTFAEVVLKNK